MTYQLTLLKYAHFQNVLQEHHFLKLNIMNKLISKIKFIKKLSHSPFKGQLHRATCDIQKLNSSLIIIFKTITGSPTLW